MIAKRHRPGGARYEWARRKQRRLFAPERDQWRRLAAKAFRTGALTAQEWVTLEGGITERGAPLTFTAVHRMVARHYWWRKAVRQLNREAAEKRVARAYRISTAQVRKCADTHRAEAQEWARVAIEEGAIRPPWAIAQMSAIAAAGFRKQKSN